MPQEDRCALILSEFQTSWLHTVQFQTWKESFRPPGSTACSFRPGAEFQTSRLHSMQFQTSPSPAAASVAAHEAHASGGQVRPDLQAERRHPACRLACPGPSQRCTCLSPGTQALSPGLCDSALRQERQHKFTTPYQDVPVPRPYTAKTEHLQQLSERASLRRLCSRIARLQAFIRLAVRHPAQTRQHLWIPTAAAGHLLDLTYFHTQSASRRSCTWQAEQ
jgi:hypothetical protein